MILMPNNHTSLVSSNPACALNHPRPARLKYLTGFVAAVALGLGGLQAASDDNEVLRELIEILREKGSISSEEYDALKKAAAPEPATTTETTAQPETPAPAPVAAEPSQQEAKPKRRDILADQTSSPITPLPKEAPWYEKIGFAGYTQVRYSTVWNEDGADLNVPPPINPPPTMNPSSCAAVASSSPVMSTPTSTSTPKWTSPAPRSAEPPGPSKCATSMAISP